jgi:hypothetical protein
MARHPAGIVVQLTFARTGEKLEKRELETLFLGLGPELARSLAMRLLRELEEPSNPAVPN